MSKKNRIKAVIAAGALAVVGVVSSACAPPPVPGGTNETIAIAAGGHVQVHVPPNRTRVGVVVLHSFGHGSNEAVDQGWNRVSNMHGFIGLYPEHVAGSWNAGLCCGTAAVQNVDDVKWLSDTITFLKLKYGLDTIYLSGFSNGGMMVERLLAENPSVSSRFAVWGAAPEMPTPGHWSGYGYIYDGANDETVPAAGGVVPLVDGGSVLIRPASATAQYLIGGHFQITQYAGYGHAPMPSWPDTAWAQLAHYWGGGPQS